MKSSLFWEATHRRLIGTDVSVNLLFISLRVQQSTVGPLKTGRTVRREPDVRLILMAG
jgi:hypothetical protein